MCNDDVTVLEEKNVDEKNDFAKLGNFPLI